MQQPRGENGQWVSLRDFVTSISDERWRAHTTEHQLIDRSIALAESLRAEAINQARQVIDSRLEKLNELRAEVIQDRGEYVTRGVFDLRVKVLEDFRSRALGFGALLAIMSGAVGAVIGSWLAG